jgi:hypothetical protein
LQILLARCPAVTHTCRGEREGVPDGQAFCLYQWEGISDMMGGRSEQGREGKGKEKKRKRRMASEKQEPGKRYPYRGQSKRLKGYD